MLCAPRLQGFLELNVAQEHLSQTTIGVEAQVIGEPGRAQVGVDDGDGRTALGQHDGQVHERRGLALARNGGGHDEAATTGVGVGEFEVGAQHPKRLSAGGGSTVGRDDRIGAGFERNTAEHGNNGEAFDVVAVVDAAVEQPEDERGDQSDQQPDQQSDGEVEVKLRQRGVIGGDGGVEHADRDRAGTAVSGLLQLVDDDVGETFGDGLRELLGGIRCRRKRCDLNDR